MEILAWMPDFCMLDILFFKAWEERGVGGVGYGGIRCTLFRPTTNESDDVGCEATSTTVALLVPQHISR